MTDTLTPADRSRQMRLVRSLNTRPEVAVRRILFSMGYRFRLRPTALPGKPDIVFPGRKKAIFVHGCFWHRHPNCGRLPKSRLDYWLPKLEANARRDRKNRRALNRLGWRVLVIWECQVKRSDRLASRLRRFLDRRW
jgi:DNA mismatch endonuclease (patch repair protein)